MLTVLKKKWMCLKSSKENIGILDLKNENLDDIPSTVFVHERTLDTLCLNSNHIKALPRELFLCMRLRKLFISDNDLTFIPPLIKTLPSLSHLDISKNYIVEIPEYIKYCPNLTVLNVSGNPLEKVPEDLSLMMCLTELYLNSTFLERLPAVTGLINLRVLELRDNKLQSLPKSFSCLISIQKLDLGFNKFTNWPIELQHLTELEEFLMNNNRINVVPKEIGKLTNLLFLDLSENVISSIHENIGNCIMLSDLYLNNNQLNELPQSICSLKKLKKMRLDNNCLRELPLSIGNFHQMYELNLSGNNLESLPSSMSSMKSLRVIWIDDNFITSLPNELCMCSSLRLLSVRSNNLEELPESLGKLSRLMVLNIVDNKISYLPHSIHLLKELKAIWIVENQAKVKMHFYPATTTTGLKAATCNLLPQQRQLPRDDNGESVSKRRQSDKIVSFDGSALQVHPHRISPAYPKEMKNAAKSPRKVIEQKSKQNLDSVEYCVSTHGYPPIDEESFEGRFLSVKPATRNSFNLNAHGDQDVKKRGKKHVRSLSNANLNESRNVTMTDRDFPQDDGMEEIDVDQLMLTEASSGDDSVISVMSYREFLRSLSQHDIHLPKKRKKHRDSGMTLLRRQQTSEVIYNSRQNLLESEDFAEREILRERNFRVPSDRFYDDHVNIPRMRTQSSFLR